MTLTEAIEVRKRIGELFPKAIDPVKGWNEHEWRVFLQECQRTGATVEEAREIVAQHRVSTKYQKPDMQPLLQAMRKAYLARIGSKGKGASKPDKDQRSDAVVKLDREAMASRIRGTVRALSEGEWEQAVREVDERKWCLGGRVLRSRLESVTEREMLPSFESQRIVLYWASIMRAHHGEGWEAKTWAVRDAEPVRV